eukprot:358975-Chlamydomonas_euryale.AAC.5
MLLGRYEMCALLAQSRASAQRGSFFACSWAGTISVHCLFAVGPPLSAALHVLGPVRRALHVAASRAHVLLERRVERGVALIVLPFKLGLADDDGVALLDAACLECAVHAGRRQHLQGRRRKGGAGGERGGRVRGMGQMLACAVRARRR